MGHPVDIQTALRPLKKSEKIETKFYDHFGVKKRCNSPTRPDLTIFDGLFLIKYKRDVKFDSFDSMRFSTT